MPSAGNTHTRQVDSISPQMCRAPEIKRGGRRRRRRRANLQEIENNQPSAYNSPGEKGNGG